MRRSSNTRSTNRTGPRAQRLDYTLTLAGILVDLMPDDAERGSVSTLPLAWRDPWSAERSTAARRNLDLLATGLNDLASRTGRTVRVAFEPEPGCVVETTTQAQRELSGMDTRFLGICLDLAHLACAWEQPADALAVLTDAGLPVVKVQVSAALGVDDPAAPGTRYATMSSRAFCTRPAPGTVLRSMIWATHSMPAWPDRGACISTYRCTPRQHRRSMPRVGRCGPRSANCSGVRTPAAITSRSRRTRGACSRPHQRPETPEQLAAGIAAELAFARDELLDLGLSVANTADIPAR